ncbi:MAG: DUF2017 domain-containing protein [Actinomycetota bacterium]|nr:DUF2017 domain-containing protein [Actinomycetota bacterium]
MTNEPNLILLSLEEQEVSLLRGLVEEMRELIEANDGGDPVHRRLFPAAYQDEDEEATFEELVGGELKAAKLGALDEMERSLAGHDVSTIELSPNETETWLRALNDIRLAIGTRLEVTEEKMSQDVDPDDSEMAGLGVLHWLAWLQQSLLDHLTTVQEAPDG